ncbi:hypothetical protein EPD60_16165 [Flaviaesturariibacter flavus]|uniref:Uncharacterized protein n=1 Tax=Flaviaesturariibacter flavus TaxID=2502780 RepID=A0A4R1B3M5_9BACT|nr:hypothetical protein [Flaviaesturariibacter flavus]TCJ12090.1 hypothetical protein EPD60_16165 [Flaviaesturariibacter flavus]
MRTHIDRLKEILFAGQPAADEGRPDDKLRKASLPPVVIRIIQVIRAAQARLAGLAPLFTKTRSITDYSAEK